VTLVSTRHSPRQFPLRPYSIVAVDLFTVPTIRFQILYVFVVLALERRRKRTAEARPSLRTVATASRQGRIECV
jgi:hypothetical protein